MPFWWPRRRKYWYGRRRFTRRRTTYRRRKRKPYRRRNRRTYRRHRRSRRRYKVRRKQKKLHVIQWQPNTIRKCKIKGTIVHVAGSHGRQYRCYTDNKYRWTHARAPGGGGFGSEKYTLQFLYNEHQMGNNYWTTSNKHLDLVRYTGCKFKVFRHLHIDFLFAYSLMYPMLLNKYSYSYIQPQKLLMAKHKKLILSMKSWPHGKRYKIIKIKCPKQLTNKWFFQESFANQGLVEINTVALDINYSYFGCCNANNLITFKFINTQFYKTAGWGNATTVATQGYKPYPNADRPTEVMINGKTVSVTIKDDTYAHSVSYEDGWFQPKLLQAEKITKTTGSQTGEQVLPVLQARYNPMVDTGVGNQVYFVSIVNSSYLPPKTDQELILEGIPLWQALHGFSDWVAKAKKDKTYLATFYIVLVSKFIEPWHTLSTRYILIDDEAIKGNSAFGEPVTDYQKTHWYPNFILQQQTVNNFVTCGPYVPKLDNQKQSTWELKSQYTFYCKWGGADLPEAEITSPQDQAAYDVPSNLTEAIQIADPSQQSRTKNLHSWDFRRGIITKSALKRIYEDTETDESLSTDTEGSPSKKKKRPQGNSVPCKNPQEEEVHQSLLNLYKEDTFQETQETDIHKLIQQQQQQQHSLRHNMLKLINQLQQKQLMLQLQTGMLN
nr:MAG: ORF1 [Torque teno midi virus]